MVFECKLDAKITDSSPIKKTLATSVKIRVINLNDNYPRFNTLFKKIKEKLILFLFN